MEVHKKKVLKKVLRVRLWWYLFYNCSLQLGEVKSLSSKEDNQSFYKKMTTAATFFWHRKNVEESFYIRRFIGRNFRMQILKMGRNE